MFCSKALCFISLITQINKISTNFIPQRIVSPFDLASFKKSNCRLLENTPNVFVLRRLNIKLDTIYDLVGHI